MSASAYLLGACGASGSVRPPAVPQPPFAPPFDPNADGCLIHTTLPPGYVIPPPSDIRYLRFDLGGVTPSVTMPRINGAPPGNITLSFQLPGYSRYYQDVWLTANAQRNYNLVHLDLRTSFDYLGWGNYDALGQLIGYAQSWGFFTSCWVLGTSLEAKTWAEAQQYFLPHLASIQKYADPKKHICVYGEELNQYAGFGEDGLNGIIENAGMIVKGSGMLGAVHYTSNYRQWMSDDDMKRLAPYVDYHFWQADPYESPALMGARLYDSRKWWPGVAPNVRVNAAELVTTRQYNGQMFEGDSRRIAWEMNCCPVNPGDEWIPQMMGGAMGYPDGSIF